MNTLKNKLLYITCTMYMYMYNVHVWEYLHVRAYHFIQFKSSSFYKVIFALSSLFSQNSHSSKRWQWRCNLCNDRDVTTGTLLKSLPKDNEKELYDAILHKSSLERVVDASKRWRFSVKYLGINWYKRTEILRSRFLDETTGTESFVRYLWHQKQEPDNIPSACWQPWL